MLPRSRASVLTAADFDDNRISVGTPPWFCRSRASVIIAWPRFKISKPLIAKRRSDSIQRHAALLVPHCALQSFLRVSGEYASERNRRATRWTCSQATWIRYRRQVHIGEQNAERRRRKVVAKIGERRWLTTAPERAVKTPTVSAAAGVFVFGHRRPTPIAARRGACCGLG